MDGCGTTAQWEAVGAAAVTQVEGAAGAGSKVRSQEVSRRQTQQIKGGRGGQTPKDFGF